MFEIIGKIIKSFCFININFFTIIILLYFLCFTFLASLMVANEEKWRRKEIWKRVKEFNNATGMNFQSQIIPWIIGDIETSVKASK